MTFALWTILAAAALPFLIVGIAKFGGPGYDNAAPRLYLDGLKGWRARADFAHRNQFESFAPFAAGVLTAQFVHAPQGRIDLLAATYIVARIAYTAAYILDWATLRSLLFVVGFACVAGLFTAGTY